MHGSTLSLIADRRITCSTDVAAFVGANEAKYVRVRSETSVIVSNGNARVGDRRLNLKEKFPQHRHVEFERVLRQHGLDRVTARFEEALGV